MDLWYDEPKFNKVGLEVNKIQTQHILLAHDQYGEKEMQTHLIWAT